MRRRAFAFALPLASALPLACMQDFDAFEPPASSADAAPEGSRPITSPGDANATDGARAADGANATDATDASAVPDACGAAGSCIFSAVSCVATCAQQRQTCEGKCNNSGCRRQCENTEGACKGACASTCVACTTSVGCPSAAACASATK